jgi:magnesium chelatase family protein
VARRLTTIFPAIRIHRVAGRTGDRTALVTTRPCRALHQTISDVGLLVGGQVPTLGEVSLSPHGGLFLDERPEFRRHVLEVLRQPLDDRMVTIIRVSTFPSSVGRSTPLVELYM